jgi:hypothetical protein
MESRGRQPLRTRLQAGKIAVFFKRSGLLEDASTPASSSFSLKQVLLQQVNRNPGWIKQAVTVKPNLEPGASGLEVKALNA